MLFILLFCSLTFTAPVTPQLLDGPFNSLGTIEITLDTGARFKICSPLFSLANGMVLCSQMGYRGAAQVFQGNYFGTTGGRMITMNFNCVGDERTIVACPGFTVNPQRVCPIKEVTSVVCLESKWMISSVSGWISSKIVCLICKHFRVKHSRIPLSSIVDASKFLVAIWYLLGLILRLSVLFMV